MTCVEDGPEIVQYGIAGHAVTKYQGLQKSETK